MAGLPSDRFISIAWVSGICQPDPSVPGSPLGRHYGGPAQSPPRDYRDPDRSHAAGRYSSDPNPAGSGAGVARFCAGEFAGRGECV